MVKKYRFGNPIETEAVIASIPVSPLPLPHISYADNVFSYHMDREEIVYGLGENVRGINKRGWIYESFCMDDFIHTEDKKSLYAAHNFLFVSNGTKNIGFFIDIPGKVTFDVGYTKSDLLQILPERPDFDFYVLEAASPDALVHEFRTIIGQSYIPPKWAFGYGQSRWGYMSAAEIREIAKKHRDGGIPLDSIYLDIDYMEAYKDFTINRETFADFEDLVAEMKEQKIHLVPIIDAGVKQEEGYSVYEEGRDKGYFCKDADGNDYIIGVWPGNCCFPDMLNTESRTWFGDQYKFLLDKGIDGFWNDMNEPAIFYSRKRLIEVQKQIADNQKDDMETQEFFAFGGMVDGLKNSNEDYAAFYHNMDGKKVRHLDVHNLFGYYMTRSASEAFQRAVPQKRILMYSRASYIGMHRYAGIWQGDNKAWWSHLLMNIKMMPSLNMCGFLYTGADLGGFGSDTTEDLMMRWLAFAAFTPLMRNHSANGTRRREVFLFDRTEAMKQLIRVRYKLLPYLYSEFVKAAIGGTMMFRPLGFVFEDEISRHTEDQLLIGNEIMIAPVYEQNAIGRVVYFPEPMKMLRFTGDEVVEEGIFEPGHHFIHIPLSDICLFIRKGHSLPLAPGTEYVTNPEIADLKLYSFDADSTEGYALYSDDGITTAIDLDANIIRLTHE